ncbi:erythroferrone [Heteronotia binoei]|uniref:erythroferrone n=1 Tax=Heteronotia binoei TaxID=13085 RepID=UPI00292F029C|nr:erythroferrone [Heteronotia binoei]XP_060096848.1 erythroferrone [Heteronotia binoei]
MAGPRLSSCPLLFLAMGLLEMASCAGSVTTEKNGSRRSHEKKSQWNEYPTGQRAGSNLPLASSNDPETITGNAHIDPRDAWMFFMKQSNKGANSRKRSKSKSQKIRFGIPGPPGPAGPPGPPGAVISQEELLREFRLLLKGIIREWEEFNLKTCDNCQEEEERDRKEENFLAQITGSLLASREQGQVKAAFHCRTRKNISIERRSLKELHLYYIPKAGEIFHRGLGLNLTNGQYKAPLSGYYIFSATLHIANRNHSNKSQSLTQDRLRLLICVESLCQQNISLETVSGMDKHSKLFTISVNGILFLQAGQYASVFVDNATGSSLTIQRGSDFSAVFLGL